MIADTGERGQRLGGNPVEDLGRIAKVLGERPADLEVKLGRLLARDLPIHLLDRRLELIDVNQPAGVGLRQILGLRHLVSGPRA